MLCVIGRRPEEAWSFLQEVAALAECRSSNITEYYASVMLPGTTELLIVMELMAGSVSDLVSPIFCPIPLLPMR